MLDKLHGVDCCTEMFANAMDVRDQFRRSKFNPLITIIKQVSFLDLLLMTINLIAKPCIFVESLQFINQRMLI